MSGVPPDTDEARAIRFALRNPTGQYRVIESEPLAALERLIARAEAAEVRAEQLEAALQPFIDATAHIGRGQCFLSSDHVAGIYVLYTAIFAARAAVAGDPREPRP